jgi:hypothetical protein
MHRDMHSMSEMRRAVGVWDLALFEEMVHVGDGCLPVDVGDFDDGE